jgi:hypothetical protein
LRAPDGQRRYGGLNITRRAVVFQWNAALERIRVELDTRLIVGQVGLLREAPEGVRNAAHLPCL